MIEFTAWPKIARLNRTITITEKIDGTNAAIGIQELEGSDYPLVYAQSRKRLITPKDDNYGFAAWVWDNAPALTETLGLGLHFGEWWGSGIQRGYGLPKGEKRFSLFNTKRWRSEANDSGALSAVPGLYVVPTVYEDIYSPGAVDVVLRALHMHGSWASPGFNRPEGIVMFHHAANMMFKVTLENDEEPKEVAARRLKAAA